MTRRRAASVASVEDDEELDSDAVELTEEVVAVATFLEKHAAEAEDIDWRSVVAMARVIRRHGSRLIAHLGRLTER